MNKEKTLSMLGLARRAGRLSMGHDTATDSIMTKKAELLILCCDVSPRLSQEFQITVSKSGKDIPVYQIDATMDEINFALGYRAGVITVNDINFAKRINELINTEECI